MSLSGGQETVHQGSESFQIGVLGGERRPAVRDLRQTRQLTRVQIGEDPLPVGVTVIVCAPPGEAVCCLTGGVRLHLRPVRPGGSEDMVSLQAGTAVVVPRGRWHRLELDAPSDLMSIILCHGTRLEERTATR